MSCDVDGFGTSPQGALHLPSWLSQGAWPAEDTYMKQRWLWSFPVVFNLFSYQRHLASVKSLSYDFVVNEICVCQFCSRIHRVLSVGAFLLVPDPCRAEVAVSLGGPLDGSWTY